MLFVDPKEWLVGDVKKWVMWTVGQYSLPYVNVDNFQLDGLALLNLTEEAFMRLAPQVCPFSTSRTGIASDKVSGEKHNLDFVEFSND